MTDKPQDELVNATRALFCAAEAFLIAQGAPTTREGLDLRDALFQAKTACRAVTLRDASATHARPER